MAKIIEDIVVIKFSTIVKDNTDPDPAITNEQIESLVMVAQELVGAAVIVEVERA